MLADGTSQASEATTAFTYHKRSGRYNYNPTGILRYVGKYPLTPLKLAAEKLGLPLPLPGMHPVIDW